ncbi:MAG TPA: polyprenyl synthetase family protein [Acidimicrobiales bacterium]|nr:polyprenyl synthetase family protein [Acidimicrobiales bacterium]
MTLTNSRSRQDGDPIATEVLAHARTLVQPALNAAASRLAPELRAALEHHLAGGGKYVRAGLALLSAGAAGGDEQVGVVGAVAMELIHNYSLIHDDIIDGDVERRHRRTLWAEFGVGPAIIAGDALSILAFQLLLEDPTNARVRAAVLLSEATQAMITGQAEDMASELRPSLTVDECLKMEAGKTGALLSCSASIGAVLAEAPSAIVDALADYGRHLGVAFQAVDDVLGIWGESSVTGKPVGSDLRQHKKSLPISIAGERGVDVYGSLASPLGQDLSEKEISVALAMLEGCGARQETMDIGATHLRLALEALDRAPLASGPQRELAVIARYVIERDQ